MTFVVPFDGSEMATAALARAVEYADALDEEVVAVSVVSERKRYAREKGWIGEEQAFDVDNVVSRLRDQVTELAPDATFEHERIREYPPAREIANEIASVAEQYDPTVMFLGSENVGRVVTPLTSIGANVASDLTYDVYVVRHTTPPRLDEIEAHPEFYQDTTT
ncbi:universal stress protein [Natronoarchaeum mannanilyticum]|uniref:UspA domain-containing protein n=1 Tax=Natronoarchaeum mannanilyticum TaxID=926360 RepID=A0AAV3T5W1_9EURY